MKNRKWEVLINLAIIAVFLAVAGWLMLLTKNKYEEKMHELTDAEFEFILDTISHPFEKDNNKGL